MPDAVNSLAEALRQAAGADAQAANDIARLLRACKASGRPPKQWTIRWNEPAIEFLQAAIGLDLIRVGLDGRRTVDIERLAQRVGGPGPLTSALDAFEPAPGDDYGKDWDAIVAATKSDNARAWLASVRRPSVKPSNDFLHVVRALDFVNEGLSTIHLSDLGARIGASSKFFRPGERGTRMLADALLFLRGQTERTPETRAAALEKAGLLFSPTAYSVLLCGPLTIGAPALDFPHQLARRGKATMLTFDTIEGATLQSIARSVITIENEAPFLAAITEGLQQDGLLVMTGGYPNRAVLALLKAVLSRADVDWMHWGDTDLAGVRIARLMQQVVGRPPIFFRCSADDVRRLNYRLIPLSADAGKSIASDLAVNGQATGAEILRTVLQEGGWLEQEAWEAA